MEKIMQQWTIEDIVQLLSLRDEHPEWKTGWDISGKTFLPGNVFFLRQQYVMETCARLGFKDDIRDALLSMQPLFKQHPALERFCWHFHCLLFGNLPESPLVPAWPVMGAIETNPSGLIQALTLLSGLSHTEDIYRKHGIPFSVLQDTLFDFDVWMRDGKMRTGEWSCRTYGWLAREMKGQIIRLGRLQFEFGKLWFPIRVYRHPVEGVVALSEPGKLFREDGQYANADGKEPHVSVWTSEFRETPEWVEGNLISPFGVAVRKTVKLDLRMWQEVLRKDDPFLSVHIPAIGPMDFEACGKSFEEAVRFFPRHFPEFKYKVFGCWSWLLDPQFESWLSPDSNIVKFLREYYLVPVENAKDKGLFDRVFLCEHMEPDLLPQQTSMQKSLVKAMKQGVSFRDGGFILFPEDLDWGKSVYRKMPASSYGL